MKLKLKKLSSAMTALAFAAVLTTTAHAQITYNTGDLLIGFEQSGAANNYVVDLGSVSQFINATGPLTFALSTADLQSAFTTNWANNAGTGTVQWGVVGGSSTSASLPLDGVTLKKNTLFYTLGELNVGTQSTPPATASNSTQNNINGNIQTFASDFSGKTPSTGSTGALQAAIYSSSDSVGWSANSPASGAFGSSYGIEQPQSGSFTGPTNSQLDLYQLNNTTQTPGSTATYLGNFTLASSGVLTYNVAVAPEPSSYALTAVGMAFLFALVLRRRKTLSA